jgi:hydrogenase/urease accessory protein HupE
MRARTMSMRASLILLVALFMQGHGTRAHESRPGYLQVTETTPARYEVIWRTPINSGMRLPVALRLSADFRNVIEPTVRELPDSLVERRVVETAVGAADKRIEFVGLQATITDVLVRTELIDGTSSTTLVRPARPWFDIAPARGLMAAAGAYFVSGIEHILLGADHLLFVLGLLLIVRSWSMLIKTITAFTLAHSITLAIATLGYAELPAPPLNAAIALSILFLAPEIVRTWRGETSFTIRHPWVVAFAFGLLHGFGFASGLSSIGLPKGEIALALLMFNLGVEAGQLAFVGVILLLSRAFVLLDVKWPRVAHAAPAYVVGALGTFWTIDRVVTMLGGTA